MIPKYGEIVDLIKKGSTLEAQEKIMELREAVVALEEDNSNLRRQVRELEEKLSFQESLRFESPFYYAQDDSVPYCPRCWEVDRKAVHLPPPSQVMAGTRYDCVECKTMYIHPRANR